MRCDVERRGIEETVGRVLVREAFLCLSTRKTRATVAYVLRLRRAPSFVSADVLFGYAQTRITSTLLKAIRKGFIARQCLIFDPQTRQSISNGCVGREDS